MKKIFNPEFNSVFTLEDNSDIGYEVSYIELSKLKPGKMQPREIFDEEKIRELSESIKNQGILQPLIVRKAQHGDDEYEIIAGERRFRAASLVNLQQIPVIIRDFSNEKASEIAIIENIQREDLNPIEEAKAYDRLLRDFNLTHEEIAKKVGKSRSAITNLLRLLELEEEVRAYVNDGRLSMGHARALLALPVNRQVEVAREVMARGLTVRHVEKISQQENAKAPISVSGSKKDKNDPILLEQLQKSFYPLKVKLTMVNDEEGRVELSFSSKDDLKRTIKPLEKTKNC